MDMTGERRIGAPRERVWTALNDPDVLRACIPGCESLTKVSDNELQATAAVKIGPIAARFNGKVQLQDLDPPNGYRISGEGQGGVAGFAKGGANVALEDAGPGETLLKYDVKAQVGGKIAQLGARLIDATAKQMADAFFDRFAATVAPLASAPLPEVQAVADGATASVNPPPVHPAPTPTQPPPAASVSLLSMLPKQFLGFGIGTWVGVLVFLMILWVLFGTYL